MLVVLFLSLCVLLSGCFASPPSPPSSSSPRHKVFPESALAKAVHAARRQKARQERRALSEGKSSGGAPLDMNCGDLTGYDCQLYIQDYLDTYINVNESYNKLLRPVTQEKPILEVDLVVTFVDLLNINTKAGSMTVYAFIDYIWSDAYLHWDESLTDNDDFHVIPNDLVYIPDIIAYNAIGGYATGLDAVATFLSSDGTVWWSARGFVTTQCHFDVTDFPFDSQTCEIDFSSWIFSVNNINISGVHLDVLSTFDNLAWEVESVTSRRELVPLWGGAYIYTFGIYSVSLTRYYNHYVTTAIVPAVVICSLVLSSLWMSEHPTRLSMGVTGLLTMIAIQWSVSAELPISENSNWLSEFLLISIFFIAICCVQCYFSYTMAARKHNSSPPAWVAFLIRLSLCFGIFGGPENLNDSTSLNPSILETKNVIVEESVAAVEMENMANNKVKESNSCYNQDKVSPESVASNESVTWKRGSRALDRISRVIIPTAYFLYVAISLATRM